MILRGEYVAAAYHQLATSGQPFDAAAIQGKLQSLVDQNMLHPFYSRQSLAELARRVAQIDMAKLGQQWRLPPQA